PAEDGMAWFGAYLPAEAAVAAYNRITTAARSLQGPDEARTLTQLRADVTAHLLLAAGMIPDTDNLKADGSAGEDNETPNSGADGTLNGSGTGNSGQDQGNNRRGGETANSGSPADGGVAPGGTSTDVVSEPRMPHFEHIKAEVLVTVPVLTLLGLSEEPAELEGFGPMDDETARKLCAGSSSFKRILTHPETGAMISFGRTTYKVPADLKRMIQIRDRCCRAPGCNRSARFTELDHTTPWAAGGTTDYESVKCYCLKHHLLKTACGWKDRQDKDGTVTFTSPAGLAYKSEPEGPVLTSRKDARRYNNTGPGHHFDPWDPNNTPPPTTGTEEPTPF
ncbi:HNH endonuclease signature motif containing protein, partial [Arthrobacter sp. H14]|uniref:HNH endonuclease signature motif containing protein n=1 Tax=Arthrobacter sp. H14 TaxID=1312959 RepID=UPI00138ADF01